MFNVIVATTLFDKMYNLELQSVSPLSMRNMSRSVVPADKACNNILYVCKAHYYECSIKEIEIKDNSANHTYKRSTFIKVKFLANNKPFIVSLNLPSNEKFEDLLYLYWIPNNIKIYTRKVHSRIIYRFNKRTVCTAYPCFVHCEEMTKNMMKLFTSVVILIICGF